jgi:hypothetical protein
MGSTLWWQGPGLLLAHSRRLSTGLSDIILRSGEEAHSERKSSRRRFQEWIIALAPLVRREVTFRKWTARGKLFCKRVFPWTPFPKTLKWLRRGHDLATESLTRTRPEEAYLGVLCGGTGGRLSCKKEPPDSLRSKRKNPFTKSLRL